MANNYQESINKAKEDIGGITMKAKQLEDCLKRILVLKKEIFNCKEE